MGSMRFSAGHRMPVAKKAKFSSQAVREIVRLDSPWNGRVSTEVEDLAENPLMGKKLRGEFEGLRSFRMGRYRIICEFSCSFLEMAYFSDRKDAYR